MAWLGTNLSDVIQIASLLRYMLALSEQNSLDGSSHSSSLLATLSKAQKVHEHGCSLSIAGDSAVTSSSSPKTTTTSAVDALLPDLEPASLSVGTLHRHLLIAHPPHLGRSGRRVTETRHGALHRRQGESGKVWMCGGWLDCRCHTSQFGRSTKSGRVGGRKKDDHNDHGQDGEVLRRGGSPDAQGRSRELVSVCTQYLHVAFARCSAVCAPPLCVTYLPSSSYLIHVFFTLSINRDSLCAYWASLGDCDTNQQYMIDTCPAACQLCWLAGTDLLH